MTRLLLHLALLFTLLCSPVFALEPPVTPDPTGRWSGKIEVPGSPLEVIVVFTGNPAFQGTISIPVQSLKDVQLVDVSIIPPAGTFRIEGIPGEPTFTGKFDDDATEFSGTFTQGGAELPFKLTRGGKTPAEEALEHLEGLDAEIEAAMKLWNVPGLGYSVVVDGEVIIAKGLGMQDVEKNIPATEDTLFSIGSSTKAFTVALLGTLVDEGKLDWDKPLIDYLPDFRMYDEYSTLHLTPRDMVTHRSGLPRHDLVWYNNNTTSRADMFHQIAFLEPNKELREQWQYNNLMFLAAGYLAGELTDSTWEVLMRERLLDPMGMKNTAVNLAEALKNPNLATPYVEVHGKLRPTEHRDVVPLAPAGSLYSSARDMAQWMLLNLGKGTIGETVILKPETIQQFHTPQMVMADYPGPESQTPTTYGMGWFIRSRRGHYEVEHGGNIDGFSALVCLYPMDNFGVSVFVNQNASPVPRMVASMVQIRISELEHIDFIEKSRKVREQQLKMEEIQQDNRTAGKRENTVPSHKLTDYVGSFMNPGYGTVAISLDDTETTLTLTMNDMVMPLEHWHFDVFHVAPQEDAIVPEDLEVSFEGDLRGRIGSFSANLEPSVKAIVFTKQPDKAMLKPEYLERLVGTYEVEGMKLHVTVTGERLFMEAEGQGTSELEPRGDDEFSLKDMTGYSVKFHLDDSGPASMITLLQPNGAFPAKRIEVLESK